MYSRFIKVFFAENSSVLLLLLLETRLVKVEFEGWKTKIMILSFLRQKRFMVVKVK